MTKEKIGKFQVLGTLGKGAHSTILHIRRSTDSRQYALKVVPIAGPQDLKFVEQAQHEFRVAQMLDHPNLIKIITLEEQKDWFFRLTKVQLLIEYVNGKTLDNMPRLSVPRLVQIFARVAAGMAHMHRRGVCHADLKPNNIMLSRSGDVKVLDYGLAWIRGEKKGRIQGTPEYMAPETAKSFVVNERSDLYNFGATMYRLVTWRHPPAVIGAQARVNVDAKTQERMLKPVRECCADAPAELADLIHRCLAFNPSQRPERMKEVQDALDQLEAKVVQSPEDSLETMEW